MAHITILIPSLIGAGAERTALKTAGGLAGSGHRVDIVLFAPTITYPQDIPEAAQLIVLCSRAQWERRIEADMPPGAVWRPERAPPLRLARLAAGLVRDFPPHAAGLLHRAPPGRGLRLPRYIESERPDIVFANLQPAELAAFFARRLTVPRNFPPIVPIMRNIAKPRSRMTKRRRLLFPEAAHVVAVSRGVAASLSTSVGVPAEKITAIYNPTFTPDIARRAAAEPDHPWFGDDGAPVILGAGRLAPQKDFPTLIEAVRRVAATRPCRLVILGEGRLRPQLEGQVRALGLENCVSLPGWVENPYAFMSRAALFVLSSRHEGFPGVLIEALACGCPAVSTDCPAGPLEILEDPGLLAPVGDPETLSQIMLRALDRPVDNAALRARAARFSVERAMNDYDKLIARIAVRPEGNG